MHNLKLNEQMSAEIIMNNILNYYSHRKYNNIRLKCISTQNINEINTRN